MSKKRMSWTPLWNLVGVIGLFKKPLWDKHLFSLLMVSR
jgi:hypothetical protein